MHLVCPSFAPEFISLPIYSSFIMSPVSLLPSFFLHHLSPLNSMIYELFGFTAYEIARHEKNELGDESFGFVLTLEDVDEEVCACFRW